MVLFVMAEMKAFLVVLSINIIYTGMFLITKAALDVGMNFSIFVFYRQAIATVLLSPIAFSLERKTAPPISFMVLIKIFFLSLVGVTGTINIYGTALKYTSASLAAAASNTLPVITFFLALIFGMEKVNIRASSSLWKLTGVAFCVAGVLTIALYRGPTWVVSHHNVFNNDELDMQNLSTLNSNKTWIMGVFLMLLSNITWSLWIVLQGPILKVYPSKILFTTYACFFSTIQSFIVAIVVERDLSQWKFGWNIKLVAVIYCAIVVTGIAFYLQIWVIEKKGPLFFAMTSPLSWIFTLVSSAFLLGEIFSLGSVLGAILLILALYCELWGKSKEDMVEQKDCSSTELEKEHKKPSSETTIYIPKISGSG